MRWKGKEKTYAGHPNIIAKHARIVLPFPYPSLLNMAGANKGNPNPANDLKHDVAASAKKKVVSVYWNFESRENNVRT